MGLFGPSCYCIDTCAVIDLRSYFPDVFPSLWTSLEGMISQGTLIAPREVFRELEGKEDEVLKWAKKNKSMFLDPDDQQLQWGSRIEEEFPGLVDPDKTTADADPFVVALAICSDAAVVTQERSVSHRTSSRVRIPDVCAHHRVDCVTLRDFFKRQGWKF